MCDRNAVPVIIIAPCHVRDRYSAHQTCYAPNAMYTRALYSGNNYCRLLLGVGMFVATCSPTATQTAPGKGNDTGALLVTGKQVLREFVRDIITFNIFKGY